MIWSLFTKVTLDYWNCDCRESKFR